jgi:hypothetical protein
LVEGAIPLLGVILQFLPPTDEDQGTPLRENADAKGTKGKESQDSMNKIAYLEDVPRTTTVDPQRLVQRPVERGVVVAKVLPQRLLGLGIGC